MQDLLGADGERDLLDNSECNNKVEISSDSEIIEGRTIASNILYYTLAIEGP